MVVDLDHPGRASPANQAAAIRTSRAEGRCGSRTVSWPNGPSQRDSEVTAVLCDNDERVRSTVPIEVEEVARIDGASPLRIFARIILPALRPVIATATIMEMLYVRLYLNNWHLIFAYVAVTSPLMVVVFLVAQRRNVAGITSSAVK